MACFKKIIFLIPLFLFVITCKGLAQQIIPLDNPSFEDVPRRGGESLTPIKGWHDCGLYNFPGETPPDIHPVARKAWEVAMLPQHGKTFLGLVVRYNDTWESLSQRLDESLEGGKCYFISLYLARSPLYKSHTTRSDEIENFTQPALFMIWGGDNYCSKKFLLAESQPVVNEEWALNEFVLHPKEDYSAITIEAFYKYPILNAYNGHVLVDNISPIIEIPCD